MFIEFDKDRNAIINPSDEKKKNDCLPKIAITCFSDKTIDFLINKFKGVIIDYVSKQPVYIINYEGNDFVLYKSLIGAPACGAMYEEVLALGVEKVIFFGSAGVLDRNITECEIIIPTFAIRDEGTSYHYLEPSEEVSVNEKYVDLFKAILNQHDYSYQEGKTWTTDAFYRETSSKVIKRKTQGCICVEMECAAVSAIAKFRNKEIFVFFYAADNLDGSSWDKRCLGGMEKLEEKLKVSLLALELGLLINKSN